MESLAEVIDDKFNCALSMAIEEGSDSIFTNESPLLGLKYEGIGLDCKPNQPNRYVVFRNGISSSPLGINDINADYWLFQIPRYPGDTRRMEDLPSDAMHGYGLVLDVNKEVVMPIAELNPEGIIAVQALRAELTELRVVERVTIPELLS